MEDFMKSKNTFFIEKDNDQNNLYEKGNNSIFKEYSKKRIKECEVNLSKFC
ncbi:Conserved hypothetical protein [Prochlorococcus marinus str. MIT 9515]|uniref:Uncharacterized protein n=1 Tax=Prochlorococcus marinus (strain MIT 9515) TaxID=167542 RepID=A2BX16_PROM5|nr:Conserved hypothetical protein [Prochlorococcus marinus str. MIT 9515]